MRIGKVVIVLIASIAFAISSCKTDCKEVIDTSGITIESPLIEVHKGLRKIKKPADLKTFQDSFPKFWKFLLAGDTSVEFKQNIDLNLYRMAKDKKAKILHDEVDKYFPDFVEPKSRLDQLFANITTFYPDFTVPEVNTLVSGFGGFTVEDGEDILIIGLEYFMDSTAKFQPQTQTMPQYMRRHYTKENIEIKSALAIAGRYLEYKRDDQRVINEMIKFGKILYFAKSVLPCRSEREILEYTQKEWAGAIANDYKIYSYFTKNQLFYSTKLDPKRLFVHPRPACVEIANECPGRIGQWLGYHIVKSYAEKKNLTLPQIMAETDPVKIFTQSGYKPEKS